MPATGKSTFGRYLAAQRGFAHYDLERHPDGWPRPTLKASWDTSRPQFVHDLTEIHARVVLDWGFPPGCVGWVRELQTAGVSLVWFTGDLGRARHLFQARDARPVEAFDAQVSAIQAAGLPDALRCTVVSALAKDGSYVSCEGIEELVFA